MVRRNPRKYKPSEEKYKSRGRKKMTNVQRRVMRNYIDTLLGREPRSTKAVMHSDLAKVQQVMSKEEVRDVFKAELRKVGLTELQIAKNFKELTNAKRTQCAIFRGQIVETKDIKDNPTRLEANKVVAKLMELEPTSKLDVKHAGGIGHMNMLEVLDDAELNEILLACEQNAGG